MNASAKAMRETLNKRIRLYGFGLAMVTIIFGGGILHMFTPLIGGADYAHFLSGLQLGLLLSVEIFLIVLVGNGRRALKDDQKLEAMYVKENDERSRAIEEKSGKRPMFTNAIVMIIAAVVAGYFSSHALFALLGAALFQLISVKVRILLLSKQM